MNEYHISLFLILCMCILKFTHADKDFNVTCMYENDYKIYPNEVGIFTLPYESLNSSDQCQANVKLVEKKSIYNRRNEKVELEVSIVTNGICLHSVDIYVGNPAKNKKIATLDCERHLTWKGQWPSMEVFMDYHFLSGNRNGSDLVTSVRFGKCRHCYKILNNPYQRKYELTSYGRKTLSFEACRYYEMSTFSFCGKTYKFNVKDDIPVCFEKHNMYSFGKRDNDCETTISINDVPMLVISYNIWKPWCIPWNLKGKSVSFKVGTKNGICLCELKLRSNNSLTRPVMCEPRYQTTTRGWSWNNNNNDRTSSDSDTDYSDDDDNVEIIAIIAAIGIVGLVTCVCCCAAGKNREDEDNRPVTAERNQPSNLYQMKTFTNNRNSMGASASNYPLLQPQQQQRPSGWSNPNRTLLQNTETASYNEHILNDSLERRGYPQPYVDDRYRTADSNISNIYNAPTAPHISNSGIQIPNVDSTEHEAGQTYDLAPPPSDLAPPPSYEEACKYQAASN